MLNEVTNHVWQSTMFAAIAGLMALAFRHNRAQVRYGIWFSASCKFLVPLWLLTSLGSRFQFAPVTSKTAVGTAVQFTVAQFSQPFPGALPQTRVTAAAHDWISIAIFGIWASGFAAVILLRWLGWCRIRTAVRSSTPLHIAAPIQIRSAPGVLEPGVVGVFRPILLLPEGIAERLEPAQLHAVLAHELCHVRRRDNLTAAIHMIVEALFWFHPLVWWIGARLVEERERACDEAVLTLGNKPHDYVQAILEVCRSYVESPLSCVSGITGSDLKKRIQAILTGREGYDLTCAKKVALGVAAAAVITIPVAVGIVSVPRIQAQPQQPRPQFQTASIKRCEAFHNGNGQELRTATFRSECTTLERLMEQAYGLFADGRMNPGSSLQVTGGPAWVTSDLYQVDAEAQSPRTRGMMNGPMLRSFLEHRLNLSVHRETREVPVYALTVTPGGPKLERFQGTCTTRDFDKPPSEEDCGTAQGSGNGFHLKAATMADLCAGFSIFLDRRIVDQTGIAGKFDMYVDLSAENPRLLNRPRSLFALSDPTAPPPPPVAFRAAESAMKKLGLNLEPSRGPREFLVIDNVERPL